MALRCSVSAKVRRGNGLTLQSYRAGRFPVGVGKNDPVMTPTAPSPLRSKWRSELMLQTEELPTAFRKASHKGVSYPVDHMVQRLLSHSFPGLTPL